MKTKLIMFLLFFSMVIFSQVSTPFVTQYTMTGGETSLILDMEAGMYPSNIAVENATGISSMGLTVTLGGIIFQVEDGEGSAIVITFDVGINSSVSLDPSIFYTYDVRYKVELVFAASNAGTIFVATRQLN